MKKIYVLALIAFALSVTGSPSPENTQPFDLRVMTFNIRNGLANDGENHWNLRKELVYDVIRQHSPDVLGIQEAYRFQLDEFKTHLPGYGEIGTGRDGKTDGEYSSIHYRTERFDVDESGTFWLSETPEEPSTHWGNRIRRICTWARLSDKKSARSFHVYNTHLDHESQPAREKSVQLIMEHIIKRKHKDPFILTGDFNAGENNPAIKFLKGTLTIEEPNPIPLVDSFRTVHPNEKTVGTGCRFTGRSDGKKLTTFSRHQIRFRSKLPLSGPT